METAYPARVILERLKDVHGEPERHATGDPISGLVGTILSQNTTNVNSGRAMESLCASFPDWGDVLDAPTAEVADAIRSGGLADQKAPTIQRALAAIERQSPDFNTGFLDETSNEAAMDFLTGIKGVGQKTAACVLMFDLDREVLPVDTHVHRVSRRLGLVPDNASPTATQAHLEELVAPEDRYPAHVLFIRHGRTTCKARNPQCGDCVLIDICDYAAPLELDEMA